MNGQITFDDWMKQQTPERRAAIQQEYLKLLEREDDLKAVRQLLQQSQESREKSREKGTFYFD